MSERGREGERERERDRERERETERERQRERERERGSCLLRQTVSASRMWMFLLKNDATQTVWLTNSRHDWRGGERGERECVNVYSEW